MNNQNLCKHEIKFAQMMQKTGRIMPINVAVLYCTKCGKIFTREVKL